MKKQTQTIPYKIFKYFFIISFVIFLTIYFSQAMGYYEYKNYKKKELTEEQIKKFEKDIEEGKEIDIESYLEPTKNYQNKISNASLNISNKIENITIKGIEFIFSGIGKLIEE